MAELSKEMAVAVKVAMKAEVTRLAVRVKEALDMLSTRPEFDPAYLGVKRRVLAEELTELEETIEKIFK